MSAKRPKGNSQDPPPKMTPDSGPTPEGAAPEQVARQEMAGGGRKRGWEAAALALARGETVAGAAAKAGIGERTLYRWLKEEEAFRQDVDTARAEMFSRALGCMAEGTFAAAVTLRQLCSKARSETVKLGAARSLLELGPRLREHIELVERIRALEQPDAPQETSREPEEQD